MPRSFYGTGGAAHRPWVWDPRTSRKRFKLPCSTLTCGIQCGLIGFCEAGLYGDPVRTIGLNRILPGRLGTTVSSVSCKVKFNDSELEHIAQAMQKLTDLFGFGCQTCSASWKNMRLIRDRSVELIWS